MTTLEDFIHNYGPHNQEFKDDLEELLNAEVKKALIRFTIEQQPEARTSPKGTQDRLTIKDLVEAAYLHGLCVENLDTGELEPPKDIADVQWIVDKIQELLDAEYKRGVINGRRIQAEGTQYKYTQLGNQDFATFLTGQVEAWQYEASTLKAKEKS